MDRTPLEAGVLLGFSMYLNLAQTDQVYLIVAFALFFHDKYTQINNVFIVRQPYVCLHINNDVYAWMRIIGFENEYRTNEKEGARTANGVDKPKVGTEEGYT